MKQQKAAANRSWRRHTGPHRIGPFYDVRAGKPRKAARNLSEPHVGAVFASRYQVVKHIANGGMGAIWEAEDLAPVAPRYRRVALKILTQWGEIRDSMVAC